MRIGLREANQRFSQAIRAVKAGEEVVLTERGRPIAVIKPLAGRRQDAVLRQLETSGVLRPAAERGPMPPWRPCPLRGRSLSQTIRDERDAT
jgi:prevent-host-death family protein